jgi:hypothetical protein
MADHNRMGSILGGGIVGSLIRNSILLQCRKSKRLKYSVVFGLMSNLRSVPTIVRANGRSATLCRADVIVGFVVHKGVDDVGFLHAQFKAIDVQQQPNVFSNRNGRDARQHLRETVAGPGLYYGVQDHTFVT